MSIRMTRRGFLGSILAAAAAPAFVKAEVLMKPSKIYVPETAWVPQGTPGQIIASLHPLPEGWLRCDGSPIDRDQYRALFDVIGASNTPDLRGRFSVSSIVVPDLLVKRPAPLNNILAYYIDTGMRKMPTHGPRARGPLLRVSQAQA